MADRLNDLNRKLKAIPQKGADGRPVTDGVFPESKEFLAGFWIVEVPEAERAYAIAAEASTAPGVGPKPFAIEVREVLGSHKDL